MGASQGLADRVGERNPGEGFFLHALGPPRLLRGTREQRLPRKALALLVCLVTDEEPWPKDAMADLLWPRSRQARTNLRKALKSIRDRADAELVQDTGDLLSPSPRLTSDVASLRAGAARSEAHHPRGDPACEDCLRAMESACGGWHGPFLEGFPLADSPPFDTWRQQRGRQLEEMHADLLAALARGHAARGRWAAAERHVRAALDQDPLDEAAQRALMRVLAWSGRRAEALQAYEGFADLLAEELDVEPAPRSLALREAIRADRLAPPEPPRAADTGDDPPAPSPGADATRSAGPAAADLAPRPAAAEASSPGPPEGAAPLLAALRAGEDDSALPPELLRRIARHAPASPTAYRLARAARWLAPPERLGRRFVEVALARPPRGGPGGRAPRRWEGLEEALRELDERALVLLGRPGSGKTTLLRHLELALATRGLRDERTPLPFLVSLASFRADEAAGGSAGDWLDARWRVRYPHMPPWRDLARDMGLVLLLDGLDEMPREPGGGSRDLTRAWRALLDAELPDAPRLRALFSCRDLDYAFPLASPRLPVAQLLLQPLSRAGMRDFVERNAPEGRSREVWRRLRASRAAGLYRRPYLLRLLTELAGEAGGPPGDAPALITAFLRQALLREVERDHPSLEGERALRDADLRQLVHGAWRGPYDLPERGALLPGLARLAERLLRAQAESEAGEGRFERAAVVDALGPEDAEAVVSAGLGLGILDEEMARDRLRFEHRILQDYFAARALAAAPEPVLVSAAWRADDLSPPLAERVAHLAAHEPLAPLPRSGWEEAMAMAVPMAGDPDGFAGELAEQNLPLAGRAVAAAPERFAPETVARLREALAARDDDPAADLRARIAAGEALGLLGDPRFEPAEGPHGPYLAPPLLRVPAAEHRIGAEDGAPDEAPAHRLRLPAFQIGRFEVTNAEYALFLRGGGYEDERFWDTEAGRRWQRGEGTNEATKASARAWTRRFREDPERLATLLAEGNIDAEWHEIFRRRVAMAPEELEAHLEEMYPGGPLRAPRYWDDPRFAVPSQPVVGICWYEARAYATWLAAQTGRPFRLPTEAEWEAAARHLGAVDAAAGGLDEPGGVPLDANTSDTHLWRPSPVGVFAAEGEAAADLLGNAWEWTASLYGREQGAPDFPYPYDPGDGREDPEASSDLRRVCRGGAWDSPRALARLSTRDAILPGGRDQAYGMRLACG